jgi:hypothetical protein
MREGIEVRLRPGDRERLEGVVLNLKSPQHHVWRARIVLLTADGVGKMAIRAATGIRHHGIGLSLYSKRLERGRFIWPSAKDGLVPLSVAQMSFLLEEDCVDALCGSSAEMV